MNRFETLPRVCLLLVLTAILVTPNAFAPKTIRAETNDSCVLTWTKISAPASNMGDDVLNGLASHSENDVWAVGFTLLENKMQQTLIEHWNGAQWSIVPSPNIAGYSNYLNAVTAPAENDAWAVGTAMQGGVAHPLIEHWSGLQWGIVPGPDLDNGSGELVAVAGAAANDVWAVGNSNGTPLLLHWNGSDWQEKSAPVGGPLLRIVAHGTNDVWILGYYAEHYAAVLHWDGTAWNIFDKFELRYQPDPYGFSQSIADFYVGDSRDIWVFGSFYAWRFTVKPQLWHWDGTGWTLNENVAYGSGPSRALAGTQSDNLWAIANWSFGEQSVLAHWDSLTWRGYSGGVADYGVMNAITASSNHDFWVVGGVPSESASGALILHGTLPCIQAPVGTPLPIAPQNGQVLGELSPTFEWSSVEDTDFYVLSIYTDPAATQLYASYSTAETHFDLPAYVKLGNGTYYWQLLACNFAGCGPSSVLHNFEIHATIPADSPLLVAPNNQSHVILTNPNFEWTTVANTARYTLEVHSDAIDGPLVRLYTAYSIPTQLDIPLGAGTFYWRVNACNDSGCGDWSSWWNFVVTKPQAPPNLLFPQKHAILHRAKPRFEWSPAPETYSYNLELRQNDPKGTIVRTIGLTNVKFRWGFPLPNGTYFWRVRACNQIGCSKWSHSRKFTIHTPP